jgi:prepilin-type N-terminal cleavage/methylation domain-containing protein
MTTLLQKMKRLSRNQHGVTLVEVMVAAFLLAIAFGGLAQIYTRGRGQIDLEEDRRKATGIAQARFDTIRRAVEYEDLDSLDDTITTFTVDGRTFQLSHAVVVDSPEIHSTEVQITISWTAHLEHRDITRSQTAATIFGRGLICPI